MDNVKTFKAIFISISAPIAAWLGPLYIPVMMLILCNIIDYITGVMAAKYRKKKINSYTSIKGIQKKISMWMLVVVGYVVDKLLIYATDTFGYNLPFTCLVACIVAIWITCNELISIMENMKDIGVKIPDFLLPLVKNIQSQAEGVVESGLAADNNNNKEEETEEENNEI